MSYYIALDSDYLQETTPKLRNTTGCSLECDADTGGAVFVCDIPNTAVPDLLQHIGAAKTIPLETEIAFLTPSHLAQAVSNCMPTGPVQ